MAAQGARQNLLCVMNTQDHAHKKFPLYLKFPCSAELVLDTEAGTWGGVHKAHRKQSFHTTERRCVRPGLHPDAGPARHGQLSAAAYPGSPEPGRRPPERQQGAGAKAQGGKGCKGRCGSFR